MLQIFAMARAAQDLGASRSQYQGEVAEIRAGGGEVSEDEDNFVVPILRLFEKSPAMVSISFHRVLLRTQVSRGGKSLRSF